MEIKVKAKTVYGMTHLYPACSKAQAFVQLTRKKTLDRADLDVIRSLGYVVTEVFSSNV